jgi:MFS family permease
VGILADAWFPQHEHVFTQTIGLLLAAPFLMLSGLTHTPSLLYVAMVLFGLGKGMYDGNTMPVLCEGINPQQRATAFGMLNFAGTFCGGIVAAAAGELKGHLGLGTISASVECCCCSEGSSPSASLGAHCKQLYKPAVSL